MNAAVHIRVVVLLVAGDGVDHDGRLLSRGGAIEISERMTADLLLQGREVVAVSFQ